MSGATKDSFRVTLTVPQLKYIHMVMHHGITNEITEVDTDMAQSILKRVGTTLAKAEYGAIKPDYIAKPPRPSLLESLGGQAQTTDSEVSISIKDTKLTTGKILNNQYEESGEEGLSLEQLDLIFGYRSEEGILTPEQDSRWTEVNQKLFKGLL